MAGRGQRGAHPRRAGAGRPAQFFAALAQLVPGATVEVRVPPFAAVARRYGTAPYSGNTTRGTPPNVVETDPRTWLALATAANLARRPSRKPCHRLRPPRRP